MVEGVRLMTAESYLDLYQFIVVDVVGSPILFMILGSVVIAYLSSKANVPGSIIVMLLIVFNGIMSYLISPILPLILIVVAFFVGSMYKRLLEG